MTREELMKREIATENQLTLNEVSSILDEHIVYVRHLMAEEQKEIRIPYLGVFRTTEKKLEKFKEAVKKKYGTTDSK